MDPEWLTPKDEHGARYRQKKRPAFPKSEFVLGSRAAIVLSGKIL